MTTSGDADRSARRRQTLRAALVGMPSADFADDASVATRCVAPGFGLLATTAPSAGSPAAADDPLAAARERRAVVLATTLHAVPPSIRSVPENLADWLLEVRSDLVHPTTGESLSVLDWVNRGGGSVEDAELNLRRRTQGRP